jgi:hypothetical protein
MHRAFHLADNPFDPELPEIGRRSGDPIHPELYRGDNFKELRAKLRELICMDVAGMAAAEAKLVRALFLDKDPKTDPVQRSAILLIVGPQGSGRTTLANMIAERVISTGGCKGCIEPWKPFELKFSNYIGPPDLRSAFTAKLEEITREFSSYSGNLLLVIENLPGSAFNHVLDASERLIRLNRVIIVTSTDGTLLKRDLAASMVHVEPVELVRLTEGQAVAWIRHRVPQYRAGDIPALENQGEKALFPFAESALKEVTNKPLQRPGTGPTSELMTNATS